MIRETELQAVLEAVKAAAQALEKEERPIPSQQAALSRVAAILSQEQLGQTLGELAVPRLAPGDLLERALAAVARAGISLEEGESRPRLWLEIGETLYTLGRWNEALVRFEEALKLSEQVGYGEGKAHALRQIGRVKRRRGQWQEAREALEHALKLYRGLEDRAGEATVRVNLGDIAFEQGDYKAAQKLYEQALEVSEGLPSTEVAGDINLSLGVIKQVLGRSGEAITHYTESLACYETGGNQRGMAQAYFNLGISFTKCREWQRAGSYYERSLELARESGDMGLVGLIYLRRGEIQAQLFDLAMAHAYGRQALEIFIEQSDPLGQADVYRLYGRLAGIKKAWDQAERFFDQSDRLLQAHGCLLGQAEVIEDRGWLYEQMGDRPKAVENYREALSRFKALGVEGSVQEVRDALLRIEVVR